MNAVDRETSAAGIVQRWSVGAGEPRRRISVIRVRAEASSGPVKSPVPRRSRRAPLSRPSISVFGEVFEVELSEGVVWLTHPRWSLVGAGPSLVAAQVDLFEEAQGLADVMLDMPPTSLSAEALAFRDYLLAHFVS